MCLCVCVCLFCCETGGVIFLFTNIIFKGRYLSMLLHHLMKREVNGVCVFVGKTTFRYKLYVPTYIV